MTKFDKFSKFINEMNESNSSNYKLEVLRRYKDDKDIRNLLTYSYDTNNYTYGVSGNRVLNYAKSGVSIVDLPDIFEYPDNVFDLLDLLNSRKLTGNDALGACTSFYVVTLDESVRDIFIKILNRDLRIGIKSRQINKVFPGLITKPNYCRCDVFSLRKCEKNIDFPAIIQVKMDGTYREFHVADGIVTAKTRSGEDYQNPVLFNELSQFPDGYYLGELTIDGCDRSDGNGIINSKTPDYNKIKFTCWDYLLPDEYGNPEYCRRYIDRFTKLAGIFTTFENIYSETPHVELIESHIVNDVSEVLKFVTTWMNAGLEGGVLKDFGYIFENKTSKKQYKIKLKVDADLKITGFEPGTIGTKREGKVGAICFANDDGTVKGKCSGFTDAELDDFTNNQDDYIGKIITVEFNDLVKADGNDYYALSHPRFKCVRTDKTETDSLERIIELRNMAKFMNQK